MLRQRSRPYLFSNTLAPVITHTTLKVLEKLSESTALRDTLMDNAAHFRKRMSDAGFDLAGAGHAIVPVMLGDARLANDIAADMLAEGIYVIGFSFPVVPKGQARIRVQLSAAHTPEQIDRTVDAFIKVGKKHGVIK
jgi:glycine C-acetyltransferase